MKNRYGNETIFDAQRQHLEHLDKRNADIQKQMKIPTLPDYSHNHWPGASTHGQLVRDSKHSGHLWVNDEPIYEKSVDTEIDYTDQKQQDKFWTHVGYQRCRMSQAIPHASGAGGFIQFRGFYTSDSGVFTFSPPDRIVIHKGGFFCTTYKITFNSINPNTDAASIAVQIYSMTQGGGTTVFYHMSGVQQGIYASHTWVTGNDQGLEGFGHGTAPGLEYGLPHSIDVDPSYSYNSANHYPNGFGVGSSCTFETGEGTYLEVVRMGGAIMEDHFSGAWARQSQFGTDAPQESGEL